MATLPFSSATHMGAALRPARVNTVISIWGNARRMESASMTGSPSSAAVANGISVFMPPTSMGISATGSLPRYWAMASTDVLNSSPEGIFSRMTVGAPMTAVVRTRPSGGSSCGRHDLDGAVLLDGLLDHQLGDVGITTTPGAQERGPQRQIVDVLETDGSHARSSVGSIRLRRGASVTSCRQRQPPGSPCPARCAGRWDRPDAG